TSSSAELPRNEKILLLPAVDFRGHYHTTWGLSEIEAFAREEQAHALAVCGELNIPLVRLQSPALTELKAALVSLHV
ncbi:hypothetical protein, partial [Pandoraea communis]|uniref:hypothetical protein n=1 Tax=Pandoraea communis TaxID=2508297 RepID=UPI001C2D1E33